MSLYFNRLRVTELWVSFGTGKCHRYITVGKAANILVKESVWPFPFSMHSQDAIRFSVRREREKSAYDTWITFPMIATAFSKLSSLPENVNEEDMISLGRIVILMNDRSSNLERVNECRRSLFSRGIDLESIPLTEDARQQHVLRATYQASITWAQAPVPRPVLPSPADWDWEQSNNT